jgi:hypothetical protein
MAAYSFISIYFTVFCAFVAIHKLCPYFETEDSVTILRFLYYETRKIVRVYLF